MSAAPPRRASPIRGVSAVLPARNEQGNLAHVVETTLEALGDAAPSFEVIIVDDGSTDATRRIAAELASTHAAVRVIHHARSQGYGSAWRSGIDNATMQYTLFVDADRQFNPIELERLIQWDDRYDLVLGYRLRRNDPFYRRFLGMWFKLIVRLLFGVKTRDVNCGFKLMRTSMLKGFTLESRGALISTEIVYRAKQAGAEIREVGVHHFPRRSGKASATNLRAAVRAVAEIVRLWKRFNQERRLAVEAARAAVAPEPASTDHAVPHIRSDAGPDAEPVAVPLPGHGNHAVAGRDADSSSVPVSSTGDHVVADPESGG